MSKARIQFIVPSYNSCQSPEDFIEFAQKAKAFGEVIEYYMQAGWQMDHAGGYLYAEKDFESAIAVREYLLAQDQTYIFNDFYFEGEECTYGVSYLDINGEMIEFQ